MNKVFLVLAALFSLIILSSPANAQMMFDNWWMWTGLISPVGIIIFIVLVLAWLWTLIDALRREFKVPIDKLVWVLVLVFTFILGSILYYFLVMNTQYVQSAAKQLNAKPAPKRKR